MPASKRALQEVSQPKEKRVRLSDEDLENFSKDELIDKVRELEDELNAVKKQPQASVAAASNVLSDAEVQSKVEAARKHMIKGIRAQMKTGSAKFSYSAPLHSKQVFDKLTSQPADAKKAKKHLSFTPTEFQDNVAYEEIETSVRYNTLNLTGKSVTVRWNENDQAFTVSGSFGL